VCILCDTRATYPVHLTILNLAHYEAPGPTLSTTLFPQSLNKRTMTSVRLVTIRNVNTHLVRCKLQPSVCDCRLLWWRCCGQCPHAGHTKTHYFSVGRLEHHAELNWSQREQESTFGPYIYNRLNRMVQAVGRAISILTVGYAGNLTIVFQR